MIIGNIESIKGSKDKGALLVRVFTGLGSYPVEGARVTVMREKLDKEEEEAEAVLHTDTAGIAGPVILDSGAFDFQTPGTEILPATYTVAVSKPGSFGVVRYGVAVYPGQTSIQTVFTVALPYGASGNLDIYGGDIPQAGLL